MQHRIFICYIELCLQPMVTLSALCNNRVFMIISYSLFLFNPQVAHETNEELRAINADPDEGFDVGSILLIAKRYGVCHSDKLGL